MHPFTTLMKELGVPEERQAATTINANWFLRQGIGYHRHAKFNEAREEALRVAKDGTNTKLS